MISLESERSILVGGGQAKGTEEVPAIEITFNVDPPPYNPEGPDPRRSGGTFRLRLTTSLATSRILESRRNQ
jgi:hypothetical protein